MPQRMTDVQYVAVPCARWRNVDPHKYIEREAKRLGVEPADLRQFFFNATQWAYDNQDQARALWGDE